MLPARLTAAALLGLMIAGCGGGGDGGGGNASGSGSGGGGGAGGTVAWNATDACALLGKDKVAQVMGAAVTATKLEPVVPDSGNGVSFSNCQYTLADGRILALMARNSVDAVHTPQEIASTRKQLAELTPQTFEDVGGLGRTAYWSPVSKQLNVFLDEHRWLIFTLTFAGTGMLHANAPSAAMKEKAIALAHVGGF